jgi:DNA polymerase III epsilon subunit-like protein
LFILININKLIVIDIEATGLDHDKCSIVSIGALEIENPTHTFYEECQIFNNALITDEALGIIGFSVKQLRDPKKLSQKKFFKTSFVLLTTVKKELC